MSSQNEEDTIISDIITKAGDSFPKTCIEVGATDGLWLSNTLNLRRDRGFKALLIESDDGNFENLRKNVEAYPNETAIHAGIAPTGPKSVDSLAGHVFSDTSDIGLLSIDIDGDDYHIFNDLKMRPRIILIEFNATVPPHMDVWGNLGTRFGCSAKAIARLATEKGYMVVDITGSNSVLMRIDSPMTSESREGLRVVNYENTLAFFKTHSITYLIQDFEGRWRLSTHPIFGMGAQIQQSLNGDPTHVV